MKLLASGWIRLCNLFRKERLDCELQDALISHLNMHIEDNLRSGMSPEEARRQALRTLGGMERTKEAVRDQRSFVVFLESLLREIRLGFRLLVKNRALSVMAIFALSLGIGASTIMFSVMYSVFVDALPYKDFNRLVVFKIQNLANVGGWKGRNFFLPDEIRAFREQNDVFEETIAYNGIRLQYDNGKTIRYWPFGEVVSSNTFNFLGVPAYLGRTLHPEDGQPGAPPVFVMNYHFWQSEFGGDPKLLNSIFVLNGVPTTLVGIMPSRFNAFDRNFWMPLAYGDPGSQVMGRLKPGVNLQTAAADLNAIAHRFQKTNANPGLPLPEKFAIVPQTFLDSLIGSFKKTLYALFAAVVLLLLIACSNVANLLLARATTRERELAMRSALGATRTRLIQQLLAESFVLALAGCLAGCAMAYFGLKLVVALIPPQALPVEITIRMNAPVLLLALCATVFTTLLCGLAPALHVMSVDLQPRLASSSKGSSANLRHTKLRSSLVVGEVALSILLLIGAGLLMRSFLVLTRADLGFDPKNVLFFRLSLPKAYNTDVDVTRQKKNALTRQVLDRLQALPGVISVSESMLEPPVESDDFSDTIIPGKPHTERWETHEEACSSGYFQLLGMSLLRGRLFSVDDEAAARYVMVVNDSFARQYFPNADPIGRKVKLEVLDRPFLDAPHNTYFEIIGVVSDFKMRDFDNPSWHIFPRAFIPYSVQGFSWRTYMARTATDPGPLFRTISAEIEAIDPNIVLSTTGTLQSSLKEFYRGPQFEVVTLASFAFIGLLLVLIGISSVLVYIVSLRTHEIGIRMALGGQPATILGMVLANGLRLITAGVAIGLLLSYIATHLLASEVSDISITNPWTFAAVAIAVASAVVTVGILACVFPAQHAARIDPMIALRHE
jgi:putative ABC transport system permease protein